MGKSYKSIKLAYSGDDVTYIGRHAHVNPNEADVGFDIIKLTKTGDNITFVQFASGSWTDKATVDWGS